MHKFLALHLDKISVATRELKQYIFCDFESKKENEQPKMPFFKIPIFLNQSENSVRMLSQTEFSRKIIKVLSQGD